MSSFLQIFFYFILLSITGGTARANLACTSFLPLPRKVTKIDLKYRPIVRKVEALTSVGQNTALIEKYKDHIVLQPKGLQPHTRDQCLGTCYIYSSQTAVETVLKKFELIPKDSLLLNAPSFGSVTTDRLPFMNGEADPAAILTGGTTDSLHSLAGRKAFYLRAEEVEKLGGSKQALKFEHDFLNVFIVEQTFKYEGKKFSEFMRLTSDLDKIILDAFIKYVQIVTKKDITASNVHIKTVEYSQVITLLNEDRFFLEGQISTRTEPKIQDANHELRNTVRSPSLPNSLPFQKKYSDFKERLIPFLVENLGLHQIEGQVVFI